MTKWNPDLDRKIGRQLKLRDLHVLQAVNELGSMAKAAAHLSVTQPAISQAIADLEAVVGVRLVDRGPRGVVPTIYGDALLRRGVEALDALKQGMRDIEFLANPGSGEVSVGADMSYIAGGFMSAIIDQMGKRHPRIAVHVVETTTIVGVPEYRELRERQVDVMLGRLSNPHLADDLTIEPLLDEAIVIVVSANSKWARQRNLMLRDLADEPWILAPGENIARSLVEEAFRGAGIAPPRPRVTTFSMQLRMQLLATGRYITVFTDTTLRYSAKRWGLKVLPFELPRRLPVVAVKLRHRSPTPAVEVFLDTAKAVTKSMRSIGLIT